MQSIARNDAAQVSRNKTFYSLINSIIWIKRCIETCIW